MRNIVSSGADIPSYGRHYWYPFVSYLVKYLFNICTKLNQIDGWYVIGEKLGRHETLKIYTSNNQVYSDYVC